MVASELDQELCLCQPSPTTHLFANLFHFKQRVQLKQPRKGSGLPSRQLRVVFQAKVMKRTTNCAQVRCSYMLVSVVHVAEVSAAAEAMMPVARPVCFAQKLTNVQLAVDMPRCTGCMLVYTPAHYAVASSPSFAGPWSLTWIPGT